MHRTRDAAVAAALILATVSVGAANEEVHWSYEGGEGPPHWAKLSPEFEVCGSGTQQSPVNLAGEIEADLAQITLNWQPTAWRLVNNGHTLQLNGLDAGYALIEAERYELTQFHFHTPSEHTIDGERFPMEAHFVHAHADGRLAVIGVMLEAGAANPLFEAIMVAAPATEDAEAVEFATLDPRALMPGDTAFFRYKGSLTTPPCSETVLWTVMDQPVSVGQEAINAFAAIFTMNARPLHPLARRYVLHRR